MESSIFRFIFRHSAREQVLLLLMTAAAFPFLYLSLDLPKVIVNEAIAGAEFPRSVLGHELDQVPYLMVLCGAFLGLVLLNGAFKYAINVYRGVVGERMLRRLRYQLFHHVLRFPLARFRRTSSGEIVAMITAETEPLGGFIGDSVALPAFQGGTLLTILVFMFVQDPVLGLAAIALYPPQAYLIPKLQRRVNALKKQRVMKVRKLSERIGEVVGGIREVHTHDTTQFELADFAARIGEIYYIRYQIYLQKFFIKFLNNFMAQITPFFFYSIGGYLVIRGSLSFGALVAVLAAYKDLSAPWKELLTYYQNKEDARIKFDLLRETFQPPDLLPEEEPVRPGEAVPPLGGELVATNLNLADPDEGEAPFPNTVSFRVRLPLALAVLGGGGSGKDRLAMVLAGLRRPATGSLRAGSIEIPAAPRAVKGRRMSYVGQEPILRAGSLKENLYYALLRWPRGEVERADPQEAAAAARRARDARLAGNSTLDVEADWIDYEAAGVDGPAALDRRAVEVLGLVDMGRDIYELGLNGTVDPQARPDLAERLLEARREVRERLRDPELAPLVEVFDREAYNTNMSVAENLMFGTPRDPAFAIDVLAENPYVRKVLHETGLMADFIAIGRQVAELMVDLFADVEPGSELFEQFSFIEAEDLPEFKALLNRTAGKRYDELEPADRNRLLSLPFRLIAARHRLGVVDEDLQQRILAARRTFAEGFGLGQPPVELFDPERYNGSVSILDNVLFGRLVYGKARSAAVIGTVIGEVLDKLELTDTVKLVGLDQQVGISGSRLSTAQRQKLCIARSLLKRPDLLVLDEATALLDAATQVRVLANVREEFRERTLIWLLHRASLAEGFDHTLVLDGGGVAEEGRYEDLVRTGPVLGRLLAEAS